MNTSQYNASQSLETKQKQNSKLHLSSPSSYKMHYNGLMYKYEAARNIKENINVTCYGCQERVHKYYEICFQEAKVCKNKNNKTKNAVKSKFGKGIGMVFYLKSFNVCTAHGSSYSECAF